ncbi:MAG: 3-deoxy-7-phosphoheptulonate synthase [Gemmatimonadaceae bacterium]
MAEDTTAFSGSPRALVPIGGRPPALVGGRELALIAGPCSVEGRDMLLATARAVRAAGAMALRGGAFKPRTSPHAFQGLGEAGLELLAEARAETGLPIVTEVTDPRQVDAVARVADVLQIGTRNMNNYPLLVEAGRTGRPVLLKRGFSSRLDEFLMAAEYVTTQGNPHVILCERGIRTFETATRNTLDVTAVPVLKARSELPVIVDPSHAGGRADLVAPLAFAAVAAGADGLMIEVHPDPARALSDGDQSITPARFAQLAAALRAFAEAAGRALGESHGDAVARDGAAARGEGGGRGAPGVGKAGDDGSPAGLESLRRRIEETDRAILELTRKRVELARRAGGFKRAHGMPVADPPRELEVEHLMMEHARRLGLPEARVQPIARALIALARGAQEDEEHS